MSEETERMRELTESVAERNKRIHGVTITLDRDFIEAVQDWRYSDEWVGARFRAMLPYVMAAAAPRERKGKR